MRGAQLALFVAIGLWFPSVAAAQCEIDSVAPIVLSGPGGNFGTSVAIDGPVAIAGAPFEVMPGSGTGAAFIFDRGPDGTWSPGQPLFAQDADFGDSFGFSVAISGTIAVVGNWTDTDFGTDAGSVYVFEKVGPNWVETVKLFPLVPSPNDRFGYSVALEGGILVVGAPGAAGGLTTLSSGAAYVFARSGPGFWTQVQKVFDPAGSPGDLFGWSVSLSDTSALVGAPGDDTLGTDAGAAYAFVETFPGTWTPSAKITASDGDSMDHFGWSVAIDGQAAVVGAPDDSDACSGCGGAYFFFNVGPGAWPEIAKVGEGPITSDLTVDDRLGAAVAIKGKTAAVGAPGNVDNSIDSGSVYLYKEKASGGYGKVNKLNGCSSGGGDEFGSAVAMSAGTLMIGAPAVDDATSGFGDVGSAYFFSSNVIALENAEVAFRFLEPDDVSVVSVPGPPPAGDPACSETPMFPRIEIEDTGNGVMFKNHQYVHRGHLWDMMLIEYPYPDDFTFDGYDVCAADELFHAQGTDCDPEVDIDVEEDYVDPVSGLTGTRTDFIWSDCYAQRDPDELGPFEVTVSIFLPHNGSLARMDLNGKATGTLPSDWAFWCGNLNLAIIEEHPNPPEPDIDYFLLTPFGHLVKNPALNLIGNASLNIPTKADALGRPSNQVIGMYDDVGRGLYASMNDDRGTRAKNFQFYGCPGDANTDAAVNISSISFQENVVPDVEFDSVPSQVGRFRGDWYSLANVYRTWLEEAEFTNKGNVSSRTDVPDFAKRLQQIGVFEVGLKKYDGLERMYQGPPPSHPSVGVGTIGADRREEPNLGPVADRVAEYMDHWGLDSMVVTQFGHRYAGGCENVGEYPILPLFVENAAAMQEKENELSLIGKDLKFVVYFLDTFYATTGTSLVWEDVAIETPAGDPITVTCDGTTLALIDPATTEWQDHMFNVAEGLGQQGVDGVYCDNTFPQLNQYDFSTDNGHDPGFGPYMTDGFADTFASIQNGGGNGNPGGTPNFITYTEFFFEAFIPKSDTYGPEQAWTDWMTADDKTVQVPLVSTLYHHYIILGPPLVYYYTHDIPPFNFPNNVLNLNDPAERAKGRTGANFTMAYGWANGCPILSPDPAIANPREKQFSYELDEEDYMLPAGTFDELRAVCAFGAELSRVRRYVEAEPFLTTGRRLRDVPGFSTTPASKSVVLQDVFNPYNPGGPKLGPETESFPTVLQAVWGNDDTGNVGIALANYTDASATADFTFDPAAYGFSGPVSAYTVTEDGEQLHTGPFTNPTPFSITLPAETTYFLRIRP